jgi:hypothetical protein
VISNTFRTGPVRDALQHPDQHAEARRVDEGDVAEIEDDATNAVIQEGLQLPAEIGRRREIDLAGRGEGRLTPLPRDRVPERRRHFVLTHD